MLLDEELRLDLAIDRFEWYPADDEGPMDQAFAKEVVITTEEKQSKVDKVINAHNLDVESTQEKNKREKKNARISVEPKLLEMGLTKREVEVLLGAEPDSQRESLKWG